MSEEEENENGYTDLVAGFVADSKERDRIMGKKLNLQRQGKLMCEVCNKEKAIGVMYRSNLGVCADCSNNPIARKYWRR